MTPTCWPISARRRAAGSRSIPSAERASGKIDGLVTWAGLSGLTGVPGSLLASVNYFGSVALLEGLRPLLANGERPAAVAISSNSTTCQPNVPMDVVAALSRGRRSRARAAADAVGALATYPATKIAVARWARRNAPTAEWAGAGITLNVVAPGTVETPLLQATRDDPTIGRFVDAFPVPVGRFARADELAAFVAVPPRARRPLLLRVGRVRRRGHRCADARRRRPDPARMSVSASRPGGTGRRRAESYPA